MAIPSDAYRRALTLIEHAESLAATRTEPWAGGTAFFNANYPSKYAQNYLRLDPDSTLTAQEIVDEADRVQGGAGLRHRRLNGYGDNLVALAPGLKEFGWQATSLVFMGHDGEIRRRPSHLRVEQRDLNGIREELIRWDLMEDENTPEIAAMLADSRSAYTEAGLLTFFAALEGDEVVGFCELWRHEGTAQVENVMTFPEHRNKGAASSVVNGALEFAYSDGSDFGFLIADLDDWPKDLYRRLGFSPIGYSWEFTLPIGATSSPRS